MNADLHPGQQIPQPEGLPGGGGCAGRQIPLAPVQPHRVVVAVDDELLTAVRRRDEPVPAAVRVNLPAGCVKGRDLAPVRAVIEPEVPGRHARVIQYRQGFPDDPAGIEVDHGLRAGLPALRAAVPGRGPDGDQAAAHRLRPQGLQLGARPTRSVHHQVVVTILVSRGQHTAALHTLQEGVAPVERDVEVFQAATGLVKTANPRAVVGERQPGPVVGHDAAQRVPVPAAGPSAQLQSPPVAPVRGAVADEEGRQRLTVLADHAQGNRAAQQGAVSGEAVFRHDALGLVRHRCPHREPVPVPVPDELRLHLLALIGLEPQRPVPERRQPPGRSTPRESRPSASRAAGVPE